MTLSIIIINYNTFDLTLKCIESIQKQVKDTDFEIILVDNASHDRSELMDGLNDLIIKPTMVFSNRNLGFANGCLRGAEKATGDYIIFVNSDVILFNDAITPLIDFMKVTPWAGVVSGQMLDGQNKISGESFGHFQGIWTEILGTPVIEQLFKLPQRHKNHLSPKIVDYVGGSFMLFDRDLFFKLGGFDTNLFLYYEEMDICYRMKRDFNRLVYHVPASTFTHISGASTAKNYAIKQELMLSHLYAIRKLKGALYHRILWLWMLIKFFFKALLKPLHWKMVGLLLRGASMTESLKHRQPIVLYP